MKRILYVVGAILFGQLILWTLGPHAPAPKERAIHPDNVGKAHGDTEKFTVEARVSQRRGALDALDMPRSEICSEAGHKKFNSLLNEYLYHRQNQYLRYPEIYGKLGADYIAKQWASADDSRIDRKVQDHFRAGRLKIAEFDGYARTLLTEIVKRDRVEGRGCAA